MSVRHHHGHLRGKRGDVGRSNPIGLAHLKAQLERASLYRGRRYSPAAAGGAVGLGENGGNLEWPRGDRFK